MNLDYLHFITHIMQTMERLRSQETGIFKKKPADLMQIFKVRRFISLTSSNDIQLFLF